MLYVVPVAVSRPDVTLTSASVELTVLELALSGLHDKFGDEAEGREDYRTIDDRRDLVITTLHSIPAISGDGLHAKAAALKQTQLAEDFERAGLVAQSLADDILRLCPTIDCKATTSPADSEIGRLAGEFHDWVAVYHQSCDEEAAAGEAGDKAREDQAQLAASHAVRRMRECMRLAAPLIPASMQGYALKARMIAFELGEWWDDENIEAGELTCRHLLDQLMAVGGAIRIPRQESKPEDILALMDAEHVEFWRRETALSEVPSRSERAAA